MKATSRGRFGLGLAWGLGVAALGCSGSEMNDGDTSSVVKELRSQEARVVPDAGEAAAAAQAEQQLALSFLHALEADSNLAFSPHSLSTAFAMLTDAAAGQTLEEIETVLHFGSSNEAFHRGQDALELTLESRNRPAIKTEQEQVDAQVLQESNDIWIRNDLPPDPAYLDTLARFYGVGVHQADFGNQPEPARLAINAKVATDTHQLITELIPQGSIMKDTVAVLTNALYFKAPWFKPLTASGSAAFHELGGNTRMPEVLRTQDELEYYAGEGFASVGLPYYGGQLEMLLIVPDDGSYDTVRSALSNDLLNEITTSRTSTTVNLTLPKFNVKSTVPAVTTLKSLGMVTPFDEDSAEFPKLVSETYPVVYISDVLHQATVAIDEVGTEASAATAIVLEGRLSIDVEAPQPIVLNVDRPFLFAIRDNPTGSLLFVGQVVAP